MYAITIRRRNGDIIAEGRGRDICVAASRLYNSTLPRGARRRGWALHTYVGGEDGYGTYHVQFGYGLPGGETTLDETVVVQVR